MDGNNIDHKSWLIVVTKPGAKGDSSDERGDPRTRGEEFARYIQLFQCRDSYAAENVVASAG